MTPDALLVLAPAAFFLGMGVAGLVRPRFVLGLFGVPLETKPGRNEVRAVYGGFGVAVAALLVVAVVDPRAWSAGAVLAVGVGVGAMALGRLAGAVVERDLAPYPTLFFAGVELTLAASLLAWCARAL